MKLHRFETYKWFWKKQKQKQEIKAAPKLSGMSSELGEFALTSQHANFYSTYVLDFIKNKSARLQIILDANTESKYGSCDVEMLIKKEKSEIVYNFALMERDEELLAFDNFLPLHETDGTTLQNQVKALMAAYCL